MKRKTKRIFIIAAILFILGTLFFVLLSNYFSNKQPEETNEKETTYKTTINHATEPQVSENIPQNIYPIVWSLSDYNVASTKSKIYFVSGSDSMLYYTNNVEGTWEVKEVGITNVQVIEASTSLLYILVLDNGGYRLLLYNVDEEKITYEIKLDENIPGNQTRSYDLSCVDETGVYLKGESDKARSGYVTEDYTVFLKVTPIGNVSVLKGFASKDVVRLALVKDDIVYYDWTDDDGNFAVYSWNRDTDKTTLVSSQKGNGIVDSGTAYYIWNNKLVFPIYGKGICIAKLDGSSEKIYKLELDTNNSFAFIGDDAYFSGVSLKKVDLSTGEITEIGDGAGNYQGTLSVFNNQLILIRYEGEPVLESVPRTIYILNSELSVSK